jgi:hypothetical protein
VLQPRIDGIVKIVFRRSLNATSGKGDMSTFGRRPKMQLKELTAEQLRMRLTKEESIKKIASDKKGFE